LQSKELKVSRDADISLSECLHSFCYPEILDDDNKYQCSKCGCYTTGEKKSTFSHLPEVLCINLKRFRYDASGSSKQTSVVQFPYKLNFSSFVDRNFGSATSYTLCGLINHSGTVNFGHYISYASRDNCWYEFNDDHVSQVPSEMVKGKEAYVLFYVRKKPVEQVQFLQNMLLQAEQRSLDLSLDDKSKYVLVPRIWWKQYLTMSNPGPPDYCPLLCEHDQIHPRSMKNIEKLVQVLPIEVWRIIQKQYPKATPLTDVIECKLCRDYLAALDIRREEEYRKVLSLDRKVLHYGEQWNYICSQWLRELKKFLKGESDTIQPPINNEQLVGNTGRLKNSLSASQYKPIAPPVWDYLVSVYGGGPAVTK